MIAKNTSNNQEKSNVLPFPARNFNPPPLRSFEGIRMPVDHRPASEYSQARLCDDSLKGDGFVRGDVAIIRKTSDLKDVTPGRLTAIWTPVGLLLKHAYITGKKIRLSDSAPIPTNLYYKLDEVRILGVVIRMERDLGN